MDINHPKISVIVPVYKVEKYLPKCIESILQQTFTDFELLLIDDGSPDSSGKICDEYAAKDSRIRVFHKENGGVSSARNLGLDNAKGEWISFIDADDWISNDFLSFDYKEADVIQKSYQMIRQSGEVIETYHLQSSIINDKKVLYKFYVNKRNNALWDKIIAKKLIGNRRFDINIKIGEDFLFFLGLVPSINTYLFSDKGCYYYLNRSNSAMAKVENNKRERALILMANLNNVNKEHALENIDNLRYSIIYTTYIPQLIKFKAILKKEDANTIDMYLKKIPWKNLTYINLKAKIRLSTLFLAHQLKVIQ